MRKVAIDLTWVRHGIVGGTESYAKNMIDGFASVNDPDIRYVLLVAKDNKNLYEEYANLANMELFVCNCFSANRINRILWQNIGLTKVLRRLNIDICIEPMYLKPFICGKDIRFITTVQDLQAAHYPEYFSRLRVLWMKLGWKNAIKSSNKVIVTSEYVKKDVLERYGINPEKLVLNYDPVAVDPGNIAERSKLKEFGVDEQKYYYMVTSLLPHKNIETVVAALGELKKRKSTNFFPLVISGVGGKSKELILELAKKNDIANYVILTPFIDERERNLLYKHCKCFFAPSLFEGFGLPPIEAMIMGAPLLSTHETCSYEISNGIAEYVDDARNPLDWADKLDAGIRKPDSGEVDKLKEKYSKENVARIFNRIIKDLGKPEKGELSNG